MKICPTCEKQNPNQAIFCQFCGTKLPVKSTSSQFEENLNHFGEEVEQIGKKIEASFEKTGEHIETWYDTTFGVFGPFLSALIAFLIFFIFLNIISFLGNTRPWLQQISNFLEPLILLFLAVFLLSSYAHYLSRKMRIFRYISPFIGAVIFIIWFWVAITILSIIGTAFNITLLNTLSTLFETLLIPLAILILLLGYVGIITSSKQETYQKKNTTQNEQAESNKEHNKADHEYKRLYRSGNDQILGGVLGGLAEYLNIDPTIIRILYVLFLFLSFGFMILAYLIAWILIPRNPSHHW